MSLINKAVSWVKSFGKSSKITKKTTNTVKNVSVTPILNKEQKKENNEILLLPYLPKEKIDLDLGEVDTNNICEHVFANIPITNIIVIKNLLELIPNTNLPLLVEKIKKLNKVAKSKKTSYSRDIEAHAEWLALFLVKRGGQPILDLFKGEE